MDSTNTVIAGSDDLSEEHRQFTGILTTPEDNQGLRIKDTIGSTSRYYGLLEDGVTVATASDNLITVTTEGTYAVYYKKGGSNKCWITNAEDSQIAYAYAAYFEANVGCDSAEGLAKPTGWDKCATRYGKLPDTTKNFIYAAEDHWTQGDGLYNMIQTYNWALTHNPNRESMSHFIVNASGQERPVSSNSLSIYQASNNVSNYIPVIVIVISAISVVTLLGAALMIKRRKEDR